MVTPRELNTVCVESIEMNGKKNCFWFYLREKNCLLLIQSEKKIVRLSWESKKKFDHKGKTIAPCITWSPLKLLKGTQIA